MKRLNNCPTHSVNILFVATLGLSVKGVLSSGRAVRVGVLSRDITLCSCARLTVSLPPDV